MPSRIVVEGIAVPRCRVVLLLTCLLFASPIFESAAQQPAELSPNTNDEFTPPEYSAWRAAEPIRIDGRLDEAAWFAAPAIRDFHFPWFEQGEKEQTVAKLLWDDTFLYIGHICQDRFITARHTERDGAIPKDDCFEIMVAPDSTRPNFYFNIEWNVIGGLVDNHRPEGPQGPRVAWNAEGVQVAGHAVGTLNDDSDEDQYWVVEVAIPLSNFAHAAPHTPPRAGDMWRMNLNRHGGDTNLQYSQWSPGDTPRPAFHTPHRFGRLYFSDRLSPFSPPAENRTSNSVP